MNGTHGNPVLFHVGVAFKQELEVKLSKNNLEDWNVKVNPQSPKPVVVIHAPVRFLHLGYLAHMSIVHMFSKSTYYTFIIKTLSFLSSIIIS